MWHRRKRERRLIERWYVRASHHTQKANNAVTKGREDLKLEAYHLLPGLQDAIALDLLLPSRMTINPFRLRSIVYRPEELVSRLDCPKFPDSLTPLTEHAQPPKSTAVAAILPEMFSMDRYGS